MRQNKKQKARTIALQNLALRAYYDHNGEDWDDVRTEDEIGDADPLALFIWGEMGDAQGDVDEAIRMINTIRGELAAVWRDLICAWFDPEYVKRKKRKKVEKIP